MSVVVLEDKLLIQVISLFELELIQIEYLLPKMLETRSVLDFSIFQISECLQEFFWLNIANLKV